MQLFCYLRPFHFNMLQHLYYFFTLHYHTTEQCFLLLFWWIVCHKGGLHCGFLWKHLHSVSDIKTTQSISVYIHNEIKSPFFK